MTTKIKDSNLHPDVIGNFSEFTDIPATGDFVLLYDQSAGRLRKVSRSKFLGSPTITSVSPTNISQGDSTGNYTFTITGKDFNTGVTAKLLTSAGAEISFDTVTRDSSTQLTCVVAKNTANITNANEPFGVSVSNTSAPAATLTGQINLNASPTFVTAAGTIGTFGQGVSASVEINATDPESAGTVTFEKQSGTLPPGMSLSQNSADGGKAIISGTTPSPGAATLYSFVIRAIDAASNTSSRSFAIQITAPTSESFTSDGTFSVPSYVSNVDLLVVAGGGAGGGAFKCHNAAGGGGAGGLVYFPCYPVTASGTIAVTVGAGSTCVPGGAAGGRGADSIFGGSPSPGLGQGGVITAKGGGGGAAISAPSTHPTDSTSAKGGAGGSGGGGGQGPGATAISGGQTTQPTQPGNSGAYGFGNAGGNATPTHVGSPNSGGGGGGAGGAGATATGGSGGSGGAGKSYTIADGTSPVLYAGGGGGGRGGGAGPGGGSAGGSACGSVTNAQANKGGGGGGAAVQNPGGNPQIPGGTGGKGIVIVRY